MAKRLYLVPIIQVVRPPMGLARVPKYIHDAGVAWAAMDFGLEPTMLVCTDLSSSQHNQLANQSDVTAIPADLDSQIGSGALSTVIIKLEAMNLLADWITATHTYRFVLQMVTGAIRVSQRVHGLLHTSGRLFHPGITLDTQYNGLTVAIQNALIVAADQFGIDHSALTNTSTMRAILKTFGQQLPPISLLGVEI